MYLYVIRHGQSHVNVGDWASLDSMDAGLTDKGHEQAQALRDWLKENERSCDALYASTMRRTQETVRYVEEAFGMSATSDDRIREIGNSALDGSALPENGLPRKFNPLKPDKAPFANRGIDIENGESWMHFRTRLGQFVDEMIAKHQGRRVYVVAHGGVISGIMDNIYNAGPYRNARTDTRNTAWSMFEYQPDIGRENWMVHSHNRIDHLIGKDLL